MGNAVRRGDTIFAANGDFRATSFMAVDLRTGGVVWEHKEMPKTTFVDAGGRFVMLNEDGELLLATPTKQGLRIDARAQVLTGMSWTPPSLAGTTLYLRDWKVLMALDLQ